MQPTATEQHSTELQAVLDNSYDASMLLDEQGLITRWNKRAEQLFGWSERDMIGRSPSDTIIPPERRDASRALTAHFLATGDLPDASYNELELMRRDGSAFLAELTVCPLPTATGYGCCFFVRDITDRKNVEHQCRHNEARMHHIANNLPVCIAYVDAACIVRFANEAYRTHFDIDPSKIVDKSMYLGMPDDLRQQRMPYVEAVLRGEKVKFEMARPVHGKMAYWEVYYLPDIRDQLVVGFHAMLNDVTATKELAETLAREATMDSLTGLLNRRGLLAHLTAAIARADRSGLALGILFLDLDDLKSVNDRYGHDAGDKVLITFARRMQQCVRTTDSVARLAGDEFIIVLETMQCGELDIAAVGNKIFSAMHQPLTLVGDSIVISTSIGAYIHKEPHKTGMQTSPEALITAADKAMYTAKLKGKNQIHFGTSSGVSRN